MAVSKEDLRGPVSALRFSTNRYPGFGLRAVDTTANPNNETPINSATASVPIRAASINPLAKYVAGDRDDRRKHKSPNGPYSGDQLEQNYQIYNGLTSPLGQVGTKVAGMIPGVGTLLGLGAGFIESGTGGWLASDTQLNYNSARSDGNLNKDEARNTTRLNMGSDNFEEAPGTGGLTKQAESGRVNDGHRPGDVTTVSLTTDADGGGDGGRSPSFSDGSWDDGSQDGGYNDSWASSGPDSWDTGDESTDVDGIPDRATVSAGSDNGSDGGGGGSSRVICTHMMRIGRMDRDLWRADLEFTADHSSSTTVRGYHFWAIPYVRLMRRDDWIGRIAVQVMEPIARHRAQELAYRIGKRKRPNYRGKVVRLVLEPLSWLIGCVVDQKDWRSLDMEKG